MTVKLHTKFEDYTTFCLKKTEKWILYLPYI